MYDAQNEIEPWDSSKILFVGFSKLGEAVPLFPHGLQVEECGSYDHEQDGYPMLRQQGKSTGEKYVAEVLRVAGDGVQALIHDGSCLYIVFAVLYPPMLFEREEREEYENTGQQQHKHPYSM